MFSSKFYNSDTFKQDIEEKFESPDPLLQIMTPDEFFKYGGFYVNEKVIFPFKPMNHLRDIEEYHDENMLNARKALEGFRDDSGKQYELVDIVKIAMSPITCLYYLTFTAKEKDADDHGIVTTFQAIINHLNEEQLVQLCRIKPPEGQVCSLPTPKVCSLPTPRGSLAMKLGIRNFQ